MAEAVETGAPAPTEPVADTRGPLERMSREERETWDLKGELPEHITGAKAAAKPAADTDDAPAVDARGQQITEGGKPISKREQRQRDTIQRGITEGIRVEREARERLEREVADLRRGQQTPPAAAQTQQTAKPDPDKEPTLDDFLDQPDPYLAYTRAVTKWDIAQAEKARTGRETAAQQEARAHEAVMAGVTAHGAREEAVKATVPDYDAKTLPVREQLDMRSPLSRAVVESEASAHLVLHFADHPEDFQRIGALGVHNLPAALVAVGQLAALYSGHSSAPGAVPPQPKLVSSAPPPPPALGTRSADPTDVSRAAVARGDVSAFFASEDAKDIARMARR